MEGEGRLDTAVAWPEGVGGKGNEGVSSYVQRIKGSIGYVEYAYAKKNNMSYALVQNKDGVYPKPDNDTFQAAAAYADWKHAPGYYQIITNSPGKDSWPIAATSFILMHKVQDKPANAEQVLKFFDWAFKNGQKMAEELRLRAAAAIAGRADREQLEDRDQGHVRQADWEIEGRPLGSWLNRPLARADGTRLASWRPPRP